MKLLKKIKYFAREYSLPFRATLIFAAILAAMVVFKFVDQATLANILSKATDGKNYVTLLSRNDPEGNKKIPLPKPDSSSEEGSSNGASEITSNPNDLFNENFSIDADTSDGAPPINEAPTNPGDDPSTSPEEALPDDSEDEFSAEIVNLFIHKTGITGPTFAPSGYVYYLKADIQTLSGPGNVRYKWDKNPSDTSFQREGNFDAPDGVRVTTINYDGHPPVACDQPKTLRIVLKIFFATRTDNRTLKIDNQC